MRKIKLLFTTAVLLLAGGISVSAQTDVTSTYITNPSFELGKSGTPAASAESGAFDAPYGWTTENLPTSGTQNFGIFKNDGKTPSSFGKSVDPADGTYYYLGRKSWSGSLAVTFSQSPTLPAGTYALDVAYKIATHASASAGTLQLKASASGSELGSKESPVGVQKGDNSNYFNNCGWTRISVPFTVATDGEVKLSIVMNFNPGNNNVKQEAIIIDDVRLYNLSAASPTDAADVTGWLTNHSFELDTYTGTKDDSSTGTEGSINLPTGWKFLLKTSGWNNCVNVTDAPSHGMYARETWAATINEVKVFQSLTNLPKGVYEISGVARTNDTGANDICSYGKVGDETTYSAAWDQSKMNATWNGVDNWQTLSSIFAVGTEGTAEVGLHSTHFMQFDNFRMKYYGDVTVAEVKLAAFVAAYNAALTTANAFTEPSMFAADWTALQSVITANTLDLNNPSLTESDLTTATANLEAANIAANAAVAGKTNYETATTLISGGTNIDMTSMITNPSFELGNTNGWTNSGSIEAQAQGNKAFDNTQENYYAERWHVSGTIDLNQTIAYLPAGVYKVEAYMFSDTDDAKLYANTTNTSVSTSGKYSVVIEIADKGSIKIGSSCTLTGSTWVCMDGFELKYLASSYATLPYTLATGKMGTDKATAQTDAETAFTSNPNMTTYNALLTAIAAAEASVANYAKLKAAIDKANDVVTKNNFVTAAAATALQDEIDAATTAWTNVTYTDAQATAEIATLGTAVSGWQAIDDSGKAGAFMASTWGKTHENWFNAPYINTWSVEGDNDGSGFSVPFFEYYDEDKKNLAANTFTATLTGLANGAYEVELWARVQRRSDADFNGDNSMITMSVNGGDAVSIMNGANIAGYDDTHTMRLGRFKAYGQVTDGTLTLSINVKLGANVHWLSWRDVNYTKIADVAIDEASDYTPVASDYANVTLTRTFSNTNWNTFVVPFDIDNATLAAEFGTVAVAEYSETAEGDNSTINFNMMATPAITANVPVLLKTSTAPASVTFNGVQIKTGDAKVAGTNYDFVGTYAASATVAADDYFIGSNKLWKSTGATTIKGTRAYIKAKTAAARIAGFAIDGEETTAINGITISKDNAPIYNLNGQRVAKPAKGMYVKNGKKVVMK